MLISDKEKIKAMSCQPKKEFGTEVQAVNAAGRKLFTVHAIHIDKFDRPEVLKFTVAADVEPVVRPMVSTLIDAEFNPWKQGERGGVAYTAAGVLVDGEEIELDD